MDSLTFEFVLIRIEISDTSWQASWHSDFLFDMSYENEITQNIASFAIAYKKLHFALSQQQLLQ